MERDNIKMDLREIGWDAIDWIVLVQDRDQWRALVITVVGFLTIAGYSRMAAQLAASQEGLSSVSK
jgi:hypothetical protein